MLWTGESRLAWQKRKPLGRAVRVRWTPDGQGYDGKGFRQ